MSLDVFYLRTNIRIWRPCPGLEQGGTLEYINIRLDSTKLFAEQMSVAHHIAKSPGDIDTRANALRDQLKKDGFYHNQTLNSSDAYKYCLYFGQDAVQQIIDENRVTFGPYD